MSQCRDWCFTSFDDAPPKWDEDKMQYMVYQREQCPETLRLHWQGYLELARSSRLKTVKTILDDPTVHLEPRRGTREQARAYAMKDETRQDELVYEFGTWREKAQGARSDLATVVACKSVVEVKEKCPQQYIKYHRGIEKLFQNPRRNFKTHVSIYWGPTGTGKSYTAFRDAGDDFYVKMPGKWWDGYSGEECCIIDEFDPNRYDVDDLLRLLDRYPLRIETKGGSADFCSRRIIITTHFDPETWYPKRTAEIMRRVEVVRDFTGLTKEIIDETQEDLDLIYSK